MIELYARSDRRRTAILQNAFDIREELLLNAVSRLTFSLPHTDPKNALCEPYTYVRRDGGELYRILPRRVERGETGQIQYRCEHVIATLSDNLLLGYHVIGGAGYDTACAIRYVLAHQREPHWQLGRCDFNAVFEYGFEQENLLGALFSLATPFTAPYQWRFDTSAYPWTLHLIRLDTSAPPDFYLRDGRNLKALVSESDPTGVCTRLYPFGYGEGVNQLSIREVNGGSAYLESPPELVEKYGVLEQVWVDRSYENAESLKAAAQAMLEELQQPAECYELTFADVSEKDRSRAVPGSRVRISDRETGMEQTLFITKLTRYFDDEERSVLTVAARTGNLVRRMADLAERQRVETTYSQGATNLYAQSLQTNADSGHGAEIHFYIPDEMRIVNKVVARIKTSRFRGYTRGIAGGGRTKATSAAGGAITVTSESGGGGTRTSQSGGGGAVTSTTSSVTSTGTSLGSQQYGETEWPCPDQLSKYREHTHEFIISPANHVHEMGHSHEVSLPAHSHTLELPEHTHTVRAKSHTHKLELPDHTHKVEPGIYLFNGCTGFSVAVNDEVKLSFDNRSVEVDLTPYLVTDGEIPRGRWHSVSVIPDNLAYVSIDMFVQGFVQSRGDYSV